MKLLDRSVGGFLAGLGLAHIGATFMIYPHWNQAAMWFMSAGLALMYIGALNLLRRQYGAIAPGLRWTCAAANLAMAGFLVAFLAVSRRVPKDAGSILLLTVIATATAFSFSPHRQNDAKAPGQGSSGP
jgi:hypothetical protein